MARNSRARTVQKRLEEALDRLQQEVIVTTQAELGSARVSPVDTGRFRSSWFAAEGSPSSEVAPEGTNKINRDAKDLQIRGERTYYLSNNLPYAQSVAIEGRVVNKPTNWFASFVNSRIPKIQQSAARVVKKEFDL